MTPELYDRARAALRSRGFDSATQTKIALFLGAARTVNAAILSAQELRPHFTIAYPFVQGQYFRELQFALLLARVTHWSPEPALYLEGALLAAPLWSEWWRIQAPLGAARDGPGAYAALALGHALLARVRLPPVIATDAGEREPFVAALRRMEQESGRMIQAQTRLLKEGIRPLGVDQRERLIEAEQVLVDDAFARFLQWLASDVDQ